MAKNQWQLQEEVLKDIYQVGDIDQIEVYYDIEQTLMIDPATVALSAITLVTIKIAENLIDDVYQNLKERLRRVLSARKHAAKLALDITLAIKTEDAVVIVQDTVSNNAEIESLMQSAKTICMKLNQGSHVDAERISYAELNDRLSGLPKIPKPTDQ